MRLVAMLLILVSLVCCIQRSSGASGKQDPGDCNIDRLTGFLQGLTLYADSPRYNVEDYSNEWTISRIVEEGGLLAISQDVCWDTSEKWLALSYNPSMLGPTPLVDEFLRVTPVLLILDTETWGFHALPGSVLGLVGGEMIRGISWLTNSKLEFLTVSPVPTGEADVPYRFNQWALYSLDLNSPSAERAVNLTGALHEIGVSLKAPLAGRSGLSVDGEKSYIGFIDGTLVAVDRESRDVSVNHVGLRVRDGKKEWMLDFVVEDGVLTCAIYLDRTLSIVQMGLKGGSIIDERRALVQLASGPAEVFGCAKLMKIPSGFLLSTRHRVYKVGGSELSVLWDGESRQRLVFAVVPREREVALLTCGELETAPLRIVHLSVPDA